MLIWVQQLTSLTWKVCKKIFLFYWEMRENLKVKQYISLIVETHVFDLINVLKTSSKGAAATSLTFFWWIYKLISCICL